MRTFLDWLNQRTGVVQLARRYLYEPLPGGARWRYAWISLLLFTFFMQAVTGFFLLTHYSASTQTAWESVFYLQHQVPGGAILRGLHSLNAQLFVVLVALQVLLTVCYRAHLAPREISFLLLVLLLPLTIGISVTGWLLPFDQKGYWAAKVPLNILTVVPLAGPWMQQLLIGGTEIGHLTLTRFQALHTVCLPLLIGTVLALYWMLTRKHGLAHATPPKPVTEFYWPHQALKDASACLAMAAALVLAVLWPWLTDGGHPGVELLAPADPSEPYAAARPEWFMLWLFQFLKLFPGGTEVWGAVIIPSLVFLVVLAMPWIGRWRFGPTLSAGFLVLLVGGASVLTVVALRADQRDATCQAAVRQAREQAERARTLALAPRGIPPEGALALIHQDARTQGPLLFARHCAPCHRFGGQDGTGPIPSDPQSASDLKGFASRQWLAGLLDPQRVASSNYFGGTKFADGKMVKFVKKNFTELEPDAPAQRQKMIAALSAEAGLKSQAASDLKDASVIAEGRALMKAADFACRECHRFREPDPDATAPDLTGYGSREWLIQFVSHPGHERFYGQRNDRMPAYGPDKILDARALGLLADWLRGEWYEPAAPP